jgi:predicted DNA-binding transcriptional regulator AlpA
MKNTVLPPPPADRLIGFREVSALVGSACKTSHTARNLARRGLIRAVQINERVVRFSEASVLAFINGSTK